MASRLGQIQEVQNKTEIPQQTGSRLSVALKDVPKQPIVPQQPKLVEKFPSTIKMLADLQIDPFSLKENPKEALKTTWNTLKDTLTQSAPKIANLFPPVGITGLSMSKEKKTPSEIIGKQLESGAAIGHLVFAPVSAFFEGANKIPVLGSASKLLSLPFLTMGETGTEVSNKIVDELPIEEKSRENIRQGMNEIFALAGQLALGKVMKIGENKIKELKTKFGEKDAKTITDKAQELAEQAKEIPPPEYREPLRIKDIPSTSRMGDIAEIAKQRGFETPEFGREPIEPKPARKFIDVPREQLPVRTEGAEKGVSSLEARIKGVFETKNVEKAKIEAENRGLDISVYDRMSKPEQIREAAKYVSRTPQKEVLEVLEGKREAPKGLLHNAIMIALEEKSLRDKNVDAAIKLASLRSTRMGQEISILTEVANLRPDIKSMSEIIRARRDFAEKKTGGKISQKAEKMKTEIKTEQTKLQLKMSEVSKLLEEITCK